MVNLANGESLLGALEEVAAEVSVLLSRLDDPRRSRPSTSQERRRLAEQTEGVTATLDSICRELGASIAPASNGPPPQESAESPETALAAVTRAQNSLDRARTELHGCVETARRHGATWREIGEALEITAQTAHKRFDPAARQRHAAYMRTRNRRRRA